MQGVTPSALFAAETHDDEAGVHYHCYLHAVDKVKTEKLYDSLVGALFFREETQESVHTTSLLRNAKHCIKFCTKEYTDPLVHNIDQGMFQHAYKINTQLKY